MQIYQSKKDQIIACRSIARYVGCNAKTVWIYYHELAARGLTPLRLGQGGKPRPIKTIRGDVVIKLQDHACGNQPLRVIARDLHCSYGLVQRIYIQLVAQGLVPARQIGGKR